MADKDTTKAEDTTKAKDTTKATAKSFKLRNNGANIRYVHGIKLLPGVETDVTAEQVDALKASKNATPLFDKKIIEIV